MANAMCWFTNMFRISRSCSIMGSYGSYYVFTRSLAPMAPRTKVSIPNLNPNQTPSFAPNQINFQAILIRWSVPIFNISWCLPCIYNNGIAWTKMGFSRLFLVCCCSGNHLASFIFRSAYFTRKTLSRWIWWPTNPAWLLMIIFLKF